MKLFGKGSKQEIPAKIGHQDIDITLGRHRTIDKQIRDLKRLIESYLNDLKKSTETSSAIAQNVVSQLAGTPGEESARVFAEIHEKIDTVVPQRLLELAHNHIINPLVEYEKELDALIPDMKRLQEKQGSLKHYQEKLTKLETKGVTLSKEEERLLRNRKKLQDVKQETDVLVQNLMDRMEHIARSKVSLLKPIYKALFQFQQQWFKQNSAALNVSLPWINVKAEHSVSAASVAPPDTQASQPFPRQQSFDDSGRPFAGGAYGDQKQGQANTSPPAAQRPSRLETYHTAAQESPQVYVHDKANIHGYSGKSFKLPDDATDRPSLKARPKSMNNMDNDALVDKWFNDFNEN